MTETVEEPKAKPESHLKSTGVVSSMTMVSRFLGLARDIVIARYFGASATPAADAFFVAFKVPNFLRRLFAEGAFSQAFVPVLSEYQATSSKSEVKSLIDHVAGTLGVSLLLITSIAVMFAPMLTLVFAPGFIQYEGKLALTTDVMRITFPYLLFISLTAFAGSILNTNNRFGVPAFTPVLLNLSLIGATLYLTPYFDQPVMALAWGVFIAGVSQLFFQLPFLKRLDLLPHPKVSWKHSGVRKIIKLMIPALFGVSVSQINLLLDTILASFLQTGSVSWLYFSDRLMELPLGVFGIAIATVLLPSLSRKHAENSQKAYRDTMDWALRSVFVIGMPAALALCVLAEPMLTTLFQYGEMTGHDVEMAGRSLRAYSLGLMAFMLIKVLAPGYFSRQDTKTPVKIGIWAMAINMVLNLSLIWSLQHAGLALATSLAAFVNAGLLFMGLYREGIYRPQAGWILFLLRLAVASVAMVMVLMNLTPAIEAWLAWGWLQRSGQLALVCGAGFAAYAVALLIVGMRPRDFKH